jgi:uncharacterized membrane protein SirB2
MIEFYGEIRLTHIAAVMASGGLFLVRGLLVQAGRPAWALAAGPRYLSYAVDTVLLTAAMMLVTILPSAVFSNGWLAAKLTLLPFYIGLGWGALRARSPLRRRLFFAGALVAFGAMFTIARAHDPLGPLAGLIRQ